MPDQSSAAREHALLQEITEPLTTLPDDPLAVAADADFPVVLRGYDREAVDAYVRATSQLVAELQARSSPHAAIKRALERVGDDVSGILQRAHDTAEQITSGSRREAEDRLEVAREEAAETAAEAERRVKELDVDTDRIWAERDRIVADTRELARQLIELADVASARFPPAEDPDPGTDEHTVEISEPTVEITPAPDNGRIPGELEFEPARPEDEPGA
jgi:cell division septum initiation protein DivIVA